MVNVNDKSDSELEVSIVMPCLNEAETITGCVAQALQSLSENDVCGEVVVADNGSTDDSRKLAIKAGARVIEAAEKGYGNALIAGIVAARGKYVLMGDADGSYNFRELPKFLLHLRSGVKLVMGCRLPKGGGVIEPGAMPWLHRWVGNPALSTIGKVFFRSQIDDFHCGLRAFHRATILDLNLHCSGMEFASEMVVKASLSGISVEQVPITLHPDLRNKAPHLRSWRDGWRHFRFMLLLSPRWLFLIPGLTLVSVGTLGFLALLVSPMTIGNITFDTNSLLVFALMILIGSQAVFFAIFTKAYGIRSGILTEDRRISRILGAQTVEIGIGGGFLLFILGLGYMTYAIFYWHDASFGDLPYSESLRIVIPAVTAIALGLQSIFCGFMLAILSLPYRKCIEIDDGRLLRGR